MLAIQALEADDWAVWRALRIAALERDPEAFGARRESFRGNDDSEPRWRARLAALPLNLAARRDHTWVGMASASEQNAGAVEVLSMWVAPSARGQGVASALIAEIVRWAEERQAQQLVLTLYVSNENARRVYERNGFVCTGVITRRSRGREDRWRMLRAIGREGDG